MKEITGDGLAAVDSDGEGSSTVEVMTCAERREKRLGKLK